MRIASEVQAQWQVRAEAVSLTGNLITERDYTGLNQQDAELRIWLPDQARQALTEIMDLMGISMTAYLTEFFAVYLYGIHEVMRMRAEQVGLYKPVERRLGSAFGLPVGDDEPEELGPEFDDPVPEMGKNIFQLKIFLPEMMKAGLQNRAILANVPLGRFTRAMICAHLFGRDIGPRKLLGK